MRFYLFTFMRHCLEAKPEYHIMESPIENPNEGDMIRMVNVDDAVERLKKIIDDADNEYEFSEHLRLFAEELESE